MKKIIRNWKLLIVRYRLTLSRATPLSLPNRSTCGKLVCRENQVSIYSGLENGNIAVTTLDHDKINMKQLELGYPSPISSLSINPFSDNVIPQTTDLFIDVYRI